MAYYFVPPQRTAVNVLRGSLRVSYPVSQTVWKDANGVWQAQECPSDDLLAVAQQLLAVSGRPSIVSNATAAQLIAAGIGTCTHISTTASFVLSVVDNGDGTFTVSGDGLTGNGDDTLTMTGTNLTDNGDGTFTLTGVG